MLMVHGPGKYTMLVDNMGLKDQRRLGKFL